MNLAKQFILVTRSQTTKMTIIQYIRLKRATKKPSAGRIRPAGLSLAGPGIDRVLVGRSKGKIPLRRPRRRWEDYITLDLKEMGCDVWNCMDIAEDRGQWL